MIVETGLISKMVFSSQFEDIFIEFVLLRIKRFVYLIHEMCHNNEKGKLLLAQVQQLVK